MSVEISLMYIYIKKKKKQWTKDSVLWDTRPDRGPIRFCSVYNNALLSVAQKRINPFPQPNSLLLSSTCGGESNAFSKSKMNVSICPPLSKIFTQSFIIVVNLVSQLCLFLNACCLSERSLYSSRWAMMLEHTMCSSNLQGIQVSETGR